MREIRFYIEGGGDRAAQKQQLRLGFQQFLRPLLNLAHDRGWKSHVILGGSRNETFKLFESSRNRYPNSVTVLLVDAEGPVSTAPWVHLNVNDKWQTTAANDDLYHLMVQTVEAWFIADPNSLATFYGQGFRHNALPSTNDIETIPKQDVQKALRDATRPTSKGQYHKVQHCADLLKRLNASTVRRHARHCDRLFTTVQRLIGT